ncbi:DNA topoisomerase [Paramuricea clavata]|uniref:DNA topoisomerase n=1 Tax=Paramuricea clavata TaxID=317549 RepID=A0A6S7HPD4_PARCT|nr:DNA topoisomerase [Paramuricea clavata]
MKDNYGRPFFVCSERKNLCKFWQWGDVFEGPRQLCQHGMVCCERKVKKYGPNQNRLFYCCRKDDSCGFFEWKQQVPWVTDTGIVLLNNPLQYRLMSNTHARCPMEKSKGHWTFHLSNGLGNVHCSFVCPLDPMDKWNVHRTFAFSVGQLPCI